MNLLDFEDNNIPMNDKNSDCKINTENILESFEKIKKELSDEKNILLNFLNEKTIADIEHKYYENKNSEIKGIKQYAEKYEKYLMVKKKYEEYLENKPLENFNDVKIYIDKKLNKVFPRKTIDSTVDNILKLNEYLKKYESKYELYIFFEFICSNRSFKIDVDIDYEQNKTAQKILNDCFSKICDKNSLKVLNNYFSMNCAIFFTYYSDYNCSLNSEPIDIDIRIFYEYTDASTFRELFEIKNETDILFELLTKIETFLKTIKKRIDLMENNDKIKNKIDKFLQQDFKGCRFNSNLDSSIENFCQTFLHNKNIINIKKTVSDLFEYYYKNKSSFSLVEVYNLYNQINDIIQKN